MSAVVRRRAMWLCLWEEALSDPATTAPPPSNPNGWGFCASQVCAAAAAGDAGPWSVVAPTSTARFLADSTEYE